MNFRSDLLQKKWQSVFLADESDVNLQWESFMISFCCMFEKNFSLKLFKFSKKQLKNYYNPQEVRDSKSWLDILLTMKTCDSSYKSLYDTEKRNHDKLLTAARANYYYMKVQSSDNKSKTMWSICNYIRGTGYKNNINSFSGGSNGF